MLTVEGPEGCAPSLVAGKIVSGQAEIREEDKNVLPIADCGGRRAVIKGVLGFVPGSPDRSPPLNLPAGAAQAYRNQIIALGSSEEDTIAHQNGRGFPGRQVSLPQNVLLRPKLGGYLPAGRAKSGAVRTTKLRPVGGKEAERQERI